MPDDSSSAVGGAVVGDSAPGDRALGGDARPAWRMPAWDPRMTTQLWLALSGRRFAAKYFAQLDTEYESLCPPQYKARTSTDVSSFRDENAKHPNWVLNHRYEYVVMDGVPLEIVRQRIALYRERLIALVGADEAQFLKATFPAADGEAERTQALGLLSEVQRFRHLRTEFDRLRNRLLLLILFLAVPFAWAFVSAVSQQNPTGQSGDMIDVAIAGLFGGYFSVLLRTGTLCWRADYAVNYQLVDKLFWNVAGTCCLSMLEGAVAALILYAMFSANLIQGDLFPKIASGENTEAGSKLWSHFHGHPKLMVWSVVAGFSERLVPDFLSVLQQERPKTSNDAVRPSDGPSRDGAR